MAWGSCCSPGGGSLGSRLQPYSLSVFPTTKSVVGHRSRIHHGPRVPLALEGQRCPRQRDPEQQLLGVVAEQEPLPRHGEHEQLSSMPLGNGPGTGVSQVAARGLRAEGRGKHGPGPTQGQTGHWGSHSAAHEIRTCAM